MIYSKHVCVSVCLSCQWSGGGPVLLWQPVVVRQSAAPFSYPSSSSSLLRSSSSPWTGISHWRRQQVTHSNTLHEVRIWIWIRSSDVIRSVDQTLIFILFLLKTEPISVCTFISSPLIWANHSATWTQTSAAGHSHHRLSNSFYLNEAF